MHWHAPARPVASIIFSVGRAKPGASCVLQDITALLECPHRQTRPMPARLDSIAHLGRICRNRVLAEHTALSLVSQPVRSAPCVRLEVTAQKAPPLLNSVLLEPTTLVKGVGPCLSAPRVRPALFAHAQIRRLSPRMTLVLLAITAPEGLGRQPIVHLEPGIQTC